MYPIPMIADKPSPDPSQLVYIGTYTGTKSKGIYVSHFNPATGQLAAPELAAETPSPSFLALHPNKRFLYAVAEVHNPAGKRIGALRAFSIDRSTGRLTFLNQASSSGGGSCHVAVDASGKCLLAADYGSGTIATLPIRADGYLGEPTTVIQHRGSSINPQRQAAPHAHQIVPDPANCFALVCDLGLDQVLVYRLDPAKASLVPHDPPFASVKPGSGPRHIAFDPSGRFVFLINELSSTLTSFAYNPKRGTLKELETFSTLPPNFTNTSYCAEVQVHASGKFVYGSNRGHDSIAVFAFDAKRARLTCLEYASTQGKTPRHFAIDPGGRWLLAENQGSDNIFVFRLDPKTGRLTPTGQSVSVGSPVCAVFLPVN